MSAWQSLTPPVQEKKGTRSELAKVKTKLAKSRFEFRSRYKAFPPTLTHTPPPAGGHERYWESFLRGSPSPQPHLLTGQQMDHGGAQTTTPPASICLCLCVCVCACVPGCVLLGQHCCGCRCDPSCLLLAPLSVIVPTWTVQFASASLLRVN